jgi:hypothetical protein
MQSPGLPYRNNLRFMFAPPIYSAGNPAGCVRLLPLSRLFLSAAPAAAVRKGALRGVEKAFCREQDSRQHCQGNTNSRKYLHISLRFFLFFYFFIFLLDARVYTSIAAPAASGAKQCQWDIKKSIPPSFFF